LIIVSFNELQSLLAEIKNLRSNIQNNSERLTERIETLTNQIGQFNAQTIERPQKWTTQIRDLGDENYTLVEPISILIEEYPNDTVIARFPEIEVFGEGNSDIEAILDLKNSILDLYDELTEDDFDNLGKLPKMWLRILNRIITEA
jgi:hypothetical protein